LGWAEILGGVHKKDKEILLLLINELNLKAKTWHPLNVVKQAPKKRA
jgi:hypothetical protein